MNLRVYKVREPKLPHFFNSPESIYSQFEDFGKIQKELFIACYLNGRNQIIDYEVVNVGDKDGARVGIDDVIKGALFNHSSKIIVIHNHPSGYLKPSEDDIEITKKLFFACSLLDIYVVDHLILTRNGLYSFNKEGLIARYRSTLKKAEKKLSEICDEL